MNDKIANTTSTLIFALVSLTAALLLLLPPHSHPFVAILCKSLIAAAGLAFLFSYKLSRGDIKIETPIDAFIFLAFAWHIITVLFSVDPITSLNSSVSFFTLILLFYISYTYSRKHPDSLLVLVLAAAAFVSVYGLFQYFFGFNAALSHMETSPVEMQEAVIQRILSGRVFSVFIYPNTFGGFLILVIPIAFAVFKTNKKTRPAAAALTALLLVNLLLTRSIASAVSLALALLLVIPFISDRSLFYFKKLLFLLFAAAAAILTLVLLFRDPAEIIGNLSGRLANYMKIMEISRDFLITGSGAGSFESVYNSFPGASYLKYGHNAILQMILENGLPGALIMILAVFFGYRSVIRSFSLIRDPAKKTLLLGFLTGITAFLLHNLADFDIYMFETSFFFVIILGLLMSRLATGVIQVKRIKLTYLLGINPGKRRSLIITFISFV
ncbi:MAG TPA: hypothetical protein ENN55_00650, partial [Firmicutes bacterium]|nr:hypothetical protein [Bacillota bacterium]